MRHCPRHSQTSFPGSRSILEIPQHYAHSLEIVFWTPRPNQAHAKPCTTCPPGASLSRTVPRSMGLVMTWR